jgi:threonine aldolase
MMEAIASARLGDAARGEDPTVTELERVAAALTGKEDALFLPSGTMANLCAVMAHGCRGGEVVVEAGSHIYNAEGGGLAAVAAAIPRPVAGRHGVMDPADVQRAIRPAGDLAIAPTRLVCVENTHNDAGGIVLPLPHLAALQEVARSAGIAVHMDGARLFNAAAYLRQPVRELCRHVDSVWFALCKGLGWPVGAVLAGPQAFMQEARRAAKMLGGGMRQAGILAAAGLVALRDPEPRHRRDHALALELARGLAAIDERLVALERVQTNIVNCDVRGQALDAQALARKLAGQGVLVNWKRDKLRFVTHAQVDEAAVRLAIRAVGASL